MAFRTVNTVVNARCEAIEARMDARVADIKGQIAAQIARMDERDARNAETFSQIHKQSAEIRSQIATLKYVVVTTGVASVIGLYAANVSTMQALLAAYDSGKTMATQFVKTAERLDRISERLDAQEQKISQRINAQ